jgi:hypothetical protein
VARKSAKLALALGVATLAASWLGTARANAGLLGCGNQTFTQPFAAWGDYSRYALAPGGTFEGTTGWSLAGGAKVVSGNEPFFLNARTDARSLLLPAGSTAKTPAVCLQTLSPAVRLVGTSSDGSAVRYSTYTRTLLGLMPLGISGTLDLSPTWDASEKQSVLLQNVLSLTTLGTQNVIFRFSPAGTATVQIDDFFVDPLLNW